MNQKYIAQRLYSLKAHAVKQTGYSRMISLYNTGYSRMISLYNTGYSRMISLYNTFNKSSTYRDRSDPIPVKGFIGLKCSQQTAEQGVRINYDRWILTFFFPIEINSI